MKEHLFQDFPDVTVEQWKQQIQTDLRGADYDEKLIFNSLDGIKVKPFYTSEDIKGSIQLPPPKPWSICERIFAETAEEGNQKARIAIEKGAESLWFIIPADKVEPRSLFEGIDLEKIPTYLNLQFLSEDYAKKLNVYLSRKNNQIFLQTDIIGNLAEKGDWFFDQKKDIQALKSIIEHSANIMSAISVNTSLYQNAGATIPQQLGYALAHLNEYLNILSQKRDFPKEFLPQFIISTGGNYFFEIAKIRALRWLYASVAREYGLPEQCLILAQPTRRDKTLYDYNVNLLRTTTQCMSAVLGGADAVYNHPYDVIFHKSNKFGERIARNQLLVMKHEAYLNKVANASDGAYYIESLTREFAEASLKIFKEVESAGGFLNLLEKGIIQDNIKESANKEQELFNKGELILIGTNKFSNPLDKMKEDMELDPFSKQISQKTFVEPIVETRLSEKQELERLEKEQAELTKS